MKREYLGWVVAAVVVVVVVAAGAAEVAVNAGRFQLTTVAHADDDMVILVDTHTGKCHYLMGGYPPTFRAIRFAADEADR